MNTIKNVWREVAENAQDSYEQMMIALAGALDSVFGGGAQ